MHQSIPAVSITPRAIAGHLLTLSVHLQFRYGLGAEHLRTPGAVQM